MQSQLKPSASMAKNKNSQIEFPSSPPSAIGEPITHFTHSNHPLTELNLPELFSCDGCKEYGSGKRFACQKCNFQLHEFCALSPLLLQNHPLHGQHQLMFHAKPKQAKAGISWPKCDVCNKSIKGFTFRCRPCGFQMHPCCAMLSTEINVDAHPHKLKLLPPLNTSSSGNDNGILCDECKKKRSGRVYRCTLCDYHLHAVCAKNSINGLKANGIPTPEKPNMIEKTARVASQLVIEFIGGLIEGFGEGVGESLVPRGRRRSNSIRARTRE